MAAAVATEPGPVVAEQGRSGVLATVGDGLRSVLETPKLVWAVEARILLSCRFRNEPLGFRTFAELPASG